VRYLLLFTFCCTLFAQLPSGVRWSTQVVNRAPASPWDRAQAVAVDSAGNIYVAGLTYSDGLPVTTGVVQSHFGGGICLGPIVKGPRISCPDVFIAKYDSQGSLLFLTYLGGNNGETLTGIAFDDSGVYVSGRTFSADFPVTASTFGVSLQPIGVAGFVTKLSPDGRKILYSTLAGLDPLLASGESSFYVSTNVSAGCSITRLDSITASVLSSTVFARPCQAMTSSRDGSVLIAGLADPGLPTTPGAWQTNPGGNSDAYIAKLSPSLSDIEWTTFAGGSGYEGPVLMRLAVNAAGDVFVSGGTLSNDFPTTPGAWRPVAQRQCVGNRPCGYLIRLSADGAKALYSTYVPGYPAWLAADSDGQVVMSASASEPFLVPPGGPWPCVQTIGATWDNYAMRFDPAGNPNWATWLGPSVPIDAVAIGSPDHLIVAGNINPSQSTFPTTSDLSMIPHPKLAGTCVQQSGAPYQRAIVFAGEPSNELSGIAPGELISIYGAGFGPAAGVLADLSTFKAPTTLAGVQVLFDGVAAPLLYVSAAQINAVVPFGVSGNSVMQIHSDDGDSENVTAAVGPAAPELLQIANSDATPNSAANPAHYGDNVTIYASGAGLMTPDASDGLVPVTAVRKIVQLLTVGLVYGPQVYAAEITYQGEAPFQVSGTVQINFRIPVVASPPGDSYDLQFVIGGATTYPAIIYVR
jgi:uncharacterized protein (TIGR03437 family)